MATFEEYQTQLRERGQQIQEAEQQVQQFNPRIQQSQIQLRSATPTSQAKVQGLEFQRTQAKQEAVQEIEKAKQEQKELENQFSQISQADSGLDEARAFQRGLNLALKGKPPFGLDRFERAGYRAGRDQLSSYTKRLSQIKEYQSALKDFENRFPDEKLVFQSGKFQPIAIQSKQFAQTIPLELYQSKVASSNLSNVFFTGKGSPIDSIFKQSIPEKVNYDILPQVRPDQGYSGYIADRNPVVGSLRFLAERGKGFLTSTEPKGGQSIFTNPVGQVGSEVAQIGTFFLPVVGAPLAVGAGIGQFTSGGRKETAQIAQSARERFNISEPISKTAIYGLSGLAGLSGLSGSARTIERLSGYPKYSTVFLSKVGSSGTQGNVASSDLLTGALTTERGLFNSNSFLSASRSRVQGVEDATGTALQGGTVGVIAPISKPVPFPFLGSARTVLGKSSPFGEISVGRSFPSPNIFSSGFEDTSNIISVAKSQAGGKAPRFFLDATAQAREEDIIGSLSKSFPIEKTTLGRTTFPRIGRGISFGLTKVAPVEEAETVGTLIIGSGKSLSKSIPTIQESQLVTAIERAVRNRPQPFAKALNVIGVTTRSVPQIVSGVSQGASQSAFQGTGQYERTNSLIPVIGQRFIQSPQERQLERQFQPLLRSQQSSQSPQLKEVLTIAQVPRIIQEPTLNFRTAQFSLQTPRQTQQPRQGIQQTPLFPTPTATPQPPRSPPIFRPRRSSSGIPTSRLNRPRSGFFTAQVRRKGIFTNIGRTQNFDDAFNLGVGRVKTTLGASLRVLDPRGQPVRLSPRTREFRPAKVGKGVNPFVLVQRRPFRLSSRSEVSEIQASRRRSPFIFGKG